MRTFTLATLLLFSMQVTKASYWPGKMPGTSKAEIEKNDIVLENDALELIYSTKKHHLDSKSFANHYDNTELDLSSSPLFILEMEDGTQISSNDFILKNTPQLSALTTSDKLPCAALKFKGQKVSATLLDEKNHLEVEWSAELRDNANYVRNTFVIKAVGGDSKVKNVVLVERPKATAKMAGTVLGSPLVENNFFMAYEHPTAKSRTNETIDLYAERDVALTDGESITENSLYGVAIPDQMRRSLLYYVERERAKPYDPFLHYNCWYDIPYDDDKAFTSDHFLSVMKIWDQKLQKPYHLKLDAFVFDDGWDDHYSLWDFNKKRFPEGFTPQGKLSKSLGTGIGVWMSPSGGYSLPHKQRMETAAKRGFEINDFGTSIAGPKYYKYFRDKAFRMVNDYNVNYFKFDGLGGDDPKFIPDMEAAAHLMSELRGLNPNLFINMSTGTWASPFWLRLVDCTWRGGADVDLYGKGTKQQQWMTYRDKETYDRYVVRGPLYPLNSLMIHGIVYGNYLQGKSDINQSSSDLRDQIHSYFGSGTNLQELYLSQDRMTDQDWANLAEGIQWSRSNQDVLVDVHWIGGNPGKNEVYGWAAWSPKKGVITLRNPSDQPQDIQLDVAKIFELPSDAATSYGLTIPWKEGSKSEECTLEAGKMKTIHLKPFEVLNFDAKPKKL